MPSCATTTCVRGDCLCSVFREQMGEHRAGTLPRRRGDAGEKGAPPRRRRRQRRSDDDDDDDKKEEVIVVVVEEEEEDEEEEEEEVESIVPRPSLRTP